MSVNHWQGYHEKWSRLRPPLRPDQDVVAAFRQTLGGRVGKILLLGVTPELADIAPDVTAVDRSQPMIDHIWPGDTVHRRARRGDWLSLEFADGTFDAAIGDGVLNFPRYPDGTRALLTEIRRVLRPGGRFVCRLFAAPDEAEPLNRLRDEAHRGAIGNFHALKWRVAMAVVRASEEPNIPVQTIRDTFMRVFPDRDALARAAGWARADIDTIDVYDGSAEVYAFPTRAQFLDAAPLGLAPGRFVEAGTYPLAERCPLLVLETRR
jgi:SAM-dependent methyltransferase